MFQQPLKKPSSISREELLESQTYESDSWNWLVSFATVSSAVSLKGRKDENNPRKTKQNNSIKDEGYQQTSIWVNLHWTRQSWSDIQHSTDKQLHTGLWWWRLLLRLTKRCTLSTKSVLFRTIYPHPGIRTSKSIILDGRPCFPALLESLLGFTLSSPWLVKVFPFFWLAVMITVCTLVLQHYPKAH